MDIKYNVEEHIISELSRFGININTITLDAIVKKSKLKGYEHEYTHISGLGKYTAEIKYNNYIESYNVHIFKDKAIVISCTYYTGKFL